MLANPKIVGKFLFGKFSSTSNLKATQQCHIVVSFVHLHSACESALGSERYGSHFSIWLSIEMAALRQRNRDFVFLIYQ